MHCVFACAVVAVVVSDGGFMVLFSCKNIKQNEKWKTLENEQKRKNKKKVK